MNPVLAVLLFAGGAVLGALAMLISMHRSTFRKGGLWDCAYELGYKHGEEIRKADELLFLRRLQRAGGAK